MGLSVIIVNYKSCDLILNCLKTLFAGENKENVEVIVVDNDSKDNCREKLQIHYPSVRFCQMGYNAGFARANNAGMRIANGDTVLLLNPDTLIINDAASQCYLRLKQSHYIAAGIQLLNEDKSPQISGNFFMKGGLNHLMAVPYLGRIIRKLGYLLKVKRTNIPEVVGVAEVDWINGAFLMVKREAIEKAGMLDEDFFLYSEEIEWCSRLKKVGVMCVYGDLHVIHLEGSSSTIAFGSQNKGYQALHDRKGFQILLSALLRIRKQFGAGWFLVHFFTYVFAVPFSFIVVLLTSIFQVGTIKKKWKNWWGYCKNVLGVCRYFFLVLFNRPYFYKVL